MVDRDNAGEPKRAATDVGTVDQRPKARSSDSDAVVESEPDEVKTQAIAEAIRVVVAPTERPSVPSIGTSDKTVINSPVAALDHAEIVRTRNFAIVGIVIAAAAALTLPLLPGGYITTRILISAVVVAIIGMAYLIHRTRNPATFHDGVARALVGWYIPALAVSASVPYFGPFSAATMLLVLGLFFTSLGANFDLALATYLTCAIVQAVTGGLVVARVIDDPGILPATGLSQSVGLICQILIQLILFCTFVVARSSRRSSLLALGELERAVRGIAQREALLEEARDELRRAVGTGRGRFTDQTLGHFRLGDLIGRGAMGEVYQGTDTRDDRPVAVKMLSRTSLGNAQHVQRFLRELQTAAMIDSPNVVRVLEVGEDPLPHLVMERLQGRDLSAVLRSKQSMSSDKIIDLVRQVGQGITAAWAVGVIHRDLKPQNIFLVGTTWKILDFGVARLAESSDTLTADQVVGTPAYMAPEQARGTAVDHRTDLYALAAIAYRVLTGHAVFSGGEIADILYRVVHTPPRRPSSHATLPKDVDLVLAIGLAKNPADRFATAAELADALADALRSSLAEPIRVRGHALVIDGAWA